MVRWSPTSPAGCNGENLVVSAFDTEGDQIGQATLLDIAPVDGSVRAIYEDGAEPALADIESVIVTIVS